MQIYLNNGAGREEMIIQIICYIYCPVNTQKTEHSTADIKLSFYRLSNSLIELF